VINLSGQMIQCTGQVTKPTGNVRSRLLGVPRNTNHTNTTRDEYRSNREQIQSSDTSKKADVMEPSATAIKIEVTANNETKVNHTPVTSGVIIKNNCSQSRKAKKKDECSSVHSEMVRQTNSLPPLRSSQKEEAMKTKSRNEDSCHKGMKLPKVSASCSIVTHYNYQGNTSKMTKIKSCSLKDLTDIHSDKQGPYVQAASTDRSWQNQLDKNVIDLNSYDMFARRSTRKYNTAKAIGMLILTKPEWPTEPAVECLSRECSQDVSVSDTSSDNCQGSEIKSGRQSQREISYSGLKIYHCAEDIRDTVRASNRRRISVNEVRQSRKHLS